MRALVFNRMGLHRGHFGFCHPNPTWANEGETLRLQTFLTFLFFNFKSPPVTTARTMPSTNDADFAGINRGHTHCNMRTCIY